MSADLRDRVSALVWSREREFAELDPQSCLVHGDFGKRNLLVRCDGENGASQPCSIGSMQSQVRR